MNKKMQYQILLIVLIAIVIFNLSIIVSSMMNTPDNVYNITNVGHNANGTVYKIEAGNMSSNETVGLILGVHPREHEIHEAVNNTIYNITSENGTNNLTKKYVIYYIKTKDNLTSREDTRPAGEELANKFIVPNIVKDKPFIVLDVHEINPDYEYSNFIFSLSNRTNTVDSYISHIANDVNLVDYQFSEGTSPEKVTKPIASKGVTTLLMETSITDALMEKQKTADNLIKSLDSLEP
ncbi:hypothetical protein SAMN05216439_0330 [Methanobrevibacter gottschalkii]|uniref:Uncharacterized protein n=2 Tax=Methanobrevibacter gottschalkii TaxID=190974 RepID=A0A3N5B3M5_9EURY|nr:MULTISPECIES: hypothetical protein [Methanobrevibacter]MCQ2970274.1 hypothetical protein [archaeon]OEC95717.1 hypothetical protein A9505_07165 [Methanobrevibacter sp. A27]RPF51913.1 hypothetical protein EDC42_1255 [Methanobrevibacter gottschalkii DSM 11977]SEL30902.1 hypothetical protein SAMN05216439_0330 [Methanobrevibacter gottschalkii]